MATPRSVSIVTSYVHHCLCVFFSLYICPSLLNNSEDDLKCGEIPARVFFALAITFTAVSLSRYRCVSLLGLVFVSSLGHVHLMLFATETFQTCKF